MLKPHRRRQQRVAYAASVRLHPSGRPHPFDGRTINLSRSGVLIESLQPCPIGTELICEIPLPGGRRRLRGRVTRLQALSPAAVGLGIEFTGLEGTDEDLLSEVVGEDDGRSRVVQVRFEGMREAMRSRARLTDDGIRLSTALPFLRLRSPVEVTFLSGRSRVQSQGHVREVELDQFGPDGTPRLAVSLSLSREDEAQGPVPTVANDVTPSHGVKISARTALGTAVAAAAADERAEPPDEEAEPPARRSDPIARILSVAAAASVVGLALLTYHTLPPIPAPAPTALRSTLPKANEPPAVRLSPSFSIQAPRPTIEPITKTTPEPEASPIAAAPATVIPLPLPEGTPGPAVQTDGAETTAIVPLSGSTAGMVHYSLSHPRGLAVNLPQAHSVLPVGLHAVGRDGLRFVWIRERPAGGVQIRFIFTSPPPDERLLELEEDAVKIRVRLHGADVAHVESSGDDVIAREQASSDQAPSVAP